MEGVQREFFNNEKKISIQDPEEAREFIYKMFEKGERPCVSVKEKRLDELSKGLPPHSSWIPGFEAVVGTFGVEPYLPSIEFGDKRKVVRVNGIDPKNVQPRFTGQDKAFHGIVVLNGPIGPNSIEVLH